MASFNLSYYTITNTGKLINHNLHLWSHDNPHLKIRMDVGNEYFGYETLMSDEGVAVTYVSSLGCVIWDCNVPRQTRDSLIFMESAVAPTAL